MNQGTALQRRSAGIDLAVQDRRRLFREGLALVLDAEPDVAVVASASTASELVAATAGCTLAMVLLELDCEQWDPFRLAVALRKRHPGLAVIGTVAGVEARTSPDAYRAGVRTIFPRDAGMRTLLLTIRSLPAAGSGRSPVASGPTIDLRDPPAALSPREVEVLSRISAGCNTQAVASDLGISPKTVENHKQRIFTKLGVQNQAHAVAVASRQGLLPLTARIPSGLRSA